MKLRSVLCLVVLSLLFSCDSKKDDQVSEQVGNPAAEGFDFANSDPAAIELADTIMAAMGGRANWNKTRFIKWDFGKRNLVWDKHTGRVRIEAPADSVIYLVNVNTGEGKVQVKGQPLLQSDSLQRMLQRAKSIWINDSYWLVMPFKLKDSGVTLRYLGEDTLAAGAKCNVLELTFKNVGDTPDNKYRLYVDLQDNLIKKWAYYEKADQDSASRIWPFDNYKKYGGILLSADRSDGRGPKNVVVANEMPDKAFEEFNP